VVISFLDLFWWSVFETHGFQEFPHVWPSSVRFRVAVNHVQTWTRSRSNARTWTR
jgi:hypothetical protein